jgi:DNA-3-methyladenine glycosylase
LKKELKPALASTLTPVPEDFFLGEEVVQLARALLGKVLVSSFDGERTSGIIVETEAYRAPEDKASHAYGNRRTARTEIMFYRGGRAYVYLIYGIHHLFNIVTGPEGTPHAVLVRALEPLENPRLMLRRRNMDRPEKRLTAGPGVLSQALGIRREHSGRLLKKESQIWLEEDLAFQLAADDILSGPRVGIDYAEEWVGKPWRFRVKDSPWTS